MPLVLWMCFWLMHLVRNQENYRICRDAINCVSTLVFFDSCLLEQFIYCYSLTTSMSQIADYCHMLLDANTGVLFFNLFLFPEFD